MKNSKTKQQQNSKHQRITNRPDRSVYHRQPCSLSLRFSPAAWSKLIFMRDITDNEVGGFGITSADDLLLVTDFALIKQQVSSVSVEFDDEAVADFFDAQVIAGLKPQQFARIWLHTHPGKSPTPSGIDEATFQRVFGSCNWSVMAIVAQDNSSYARLRFTAGPGGEMLIPVYIDYNCEFPAVDFDSWRKLYRANVTEDISLASGYMPYQRGIVETGIFGSDDFDITDDDQFIESDFWDEYESDGFYG